MKPLGMIPAHLGYERAARACYITRLLANSDHLDKEGHYYEKTSTWMKTLILLGLILGVVVCMNHTVIAEGPPKVFAVPSDGKASSVGDQRIWGKVCCQC